MSKTIFGAALALSLAATAAPASAATVTIDVSGHNSSGTFGAAGNDVQTFNIGAGAHVTDIAYSVTLTAFNPSWLSEANLAITASNPLNGVLFFPSGDDNSGTGSYTGGFSLTDFGVDFFTAADGLLRVEYFEFIDDQGVEPDAVWNSGSLTVTYSPAAEVLAPALPEPSTWATMIAGFGIAGASLRRRRRPALAAA